MFRRTRTSPTAIGGWTGAMIAPAVLLIALGCLRCISVFQVFEVNDAGERIRELIHRELIIRSELYRLCIRSAIVFTIVVVAVLPILFFYSPGKPA